MAAPTTCSSPEKSSCQPGAVHTWLHRPPAARVKKVLANPEPSTHGPSAKVLAPAKKRLVIGVLQTRFSHLEFLRILTRCGHDVPVKSIKSEPLSHHIYIASLIAR